MPGHMDLGVLAITVQLEIAHGGEDLVALALCPDHAVERGEGHVGRLVGQHQSPPSHAPRSATPSAASSGP